MEGARSKKFQNSAARKKVGPCHVQRAPWPTVYSVLPLFLFTRRRGSKRSPSWVLIMAKAASARSGQSPSKSLSAPSVPSASKLAPSPQTPHPLFLQKLLGPDPQVSPRQACVYLFVVFPFFALLGVFTFRLLSGPSPSAPSNGGVYCTGTCSLPSPPPSVAATNPSNSFDRCEARDPMSVMFLRVPKAASTRFLTLAGRVKTDKKGFMMEEFFDYRDAVMGSSEGSDLWDIKRLITTPLEKEKYFKGVMAKVGIHANGHVGRGGMPWPSSGLAAGAAAPAPREDKRGRNLRMLWYGHMFLPPFPAGRHFAEMKDRSKIPSVFTFVKDPILRTASGYNYIRVGARTEQVRV